VRDFQDCLEQAMQFTADWLGLEAGGSATVNADVDLTEADSAELDALLKMRAQRDLSRKAFLKEMKSRQVLSDDFDEDEDAEQLKEEATSSMGDMFGNGNGTQTPPADPNNPPTDPNAPPVDPSNPPQPQPNDPALNPGAD
jgi:hypothetical protein